MLRAVFDTNIVVSALVFAGRLAWLRSAWAKGALVPIVCSETVGELLRVLSYPKFKLNAPERALLLQDYLPAAEIMSLAGVQSISSVCRDPYDNVFLALAHHAGVDLVSGDADLTVLRDTSPVRIISVADLYETLHSS